ncbi:peptidyl-prolyl cis-trans isomerase [Bacillus marasmi]|uniref:peptidyl-prolyl cis-trans isomerase n=1 Tax=Bacillus marasmi TaxID=1926279 RepID=UPI0011C9E268|nr:peptidyl-prolyl cis-trans isomerase [Bacillus marasmi]
MKKQHFLIIIACLVVFNIATIAYFLYRSTDSGESVASIGKEDITRQEWLNEMEARYGESVLKDLVDQKVIKQIAQKYNITVSDKEVERELLFVRTTSYMENQQKNKEKLKEQIKLNLLLEEILTKDVAIPNKDLMNYYEGNKKQFSIPNAYHLSQIIVKTKKEALRTIQELEQDSSFEVLAMEKSIDDFSANQGGDIGFVSENEERVSPDILVKIKKLSPGKWTEPIKTEEGYAIFLLKEKISERNYDFKEVKNQIRRQLALEQMGMRLNADVFWDEAKVEWFYGNKEN